MLFGQQRTDTRQVFFDAWQKWQQQQGLTRQEQRIVAIIQAHPEYHYLFNDRDRYLDRDFFGQLGETNPFLHMSLHLSVQEQVSLNQPHGIRKLFQRAQHVFQSSHEAEHCLANSLAAELAAMQYHAHAFAEKAYLKRIKKALKQGYW
jgi:hypothetical protein